MYWQNILPLFQKSWLKNNHLYRKVNLYYRIFHPLTTTGLAPFLFLIVLNVRICIGLKRLRQSQERRNAQNNLSGKVYIFWEGHKILRNLRLTFDYSKYIQSKVMWRFRKILWPSQNIWTLQKDKNQRKARQRKCLVLCVPFVFRTCYNIPLPSYNFPVSFSKKCQLYQDTTKYKRIFYYFY